MSPEQALQSAGHKRLSNPGQSLSYLFPSGTNPWAQVAPDSGLIALDFLSFLSASMVVPPVLLDVLCFTQRFFIVSILFLWKSSSGVQALAPFFFTLISVCCKTGES